MLRIGQGYDLHRIGPGRRLVLGGVVIPWDRGLIGHSDADVLLHAITDAVLGALALGDIGRWFPDTDAAFLDCDSAVLLQRVLRAPQVIPWHLVNLDATILAQRPRLATHMDAIRARLAELFAVSAEQISVKAKTGEEVDAVGRGEAMAAQAVVLLQHSSDAAAAGSL